MRKMPALASLTLMLAACRPASDVTTPDASRPDPQPTAQASALPTIAAQSAAATAPQPTRNVPGDVIIEVPGVTLPPGFSLIKYADFFRPTGLAFDEHRRLYATSFDGTLHILSDDNGDGRADSDALLMRGLDTPLGVTVHQPSGDVYVSSMGIITVARDTDGDLLFDEISTFVDDLPFGRHQNDNLKFGPDGMLYIGVGSTCDACREADRRSAGIMRFDIDTGQGEVVASGMRNPYDLAFHPATGSLFATDNGRDDLGETAPLEELNHVLPGAHYGWPDCWDQLQGTACQNTQPAVAFFQARSSVNSIDFYTGDAFPEEYQNDLFVAVFGSFLVEIERGIWRVRLTHAGDGYTSEVEWFARWPDGWLLGLIQGTDGALYVGDYINGGIYRISYGLP